MIKIEEFKELLDRANGQVKKGKTDAVFAIVKYNDRFSVLCQGETIDIGSVFTELFVNKPEMMLVIGGAINGASQILNSERSKTKPNLN